MTRILRASFIPLAFALTLAGTHALASDKTMKFNYQDAEIVKVLKDYAEASGQKFVISPQVRGKITIINPGPISLAEAFNQLSTALATNSFGISDQEGAMLVQEARSIQRNYLEVSTELPPLRPEKMFTWVINLKHAKAHDVNKELRILTSKDGELVPYSRTNQILITDWVSNLHRVSKLLEKIDTKATIKK